MKNVLLFAAALLAIASVASSAGNLPPEFSYTIYVEGQEVGRSTTKVTEETGVYVFDTSTDLAFNDFKLSLDTRTVVDNKTFLPLSFTYTGDKMGTLLDGETTITENEATCVTGEHGQSYTSTRTSPHPNVLLFEEYVMDHEVIIARAFWEGGPEAKKYGILFPSAARMSAATIDKGSELAFESDTKEAYCVKLIISLQGGSPYASYYDPERGLPVYLAFPGTSTEVFLDEFFDGKPVSRYRKH